MAGLGLKRSALVLALVLVLPWALFAYTSDDLMEMAQTGNTDIKNATVDAQNAALDVQSAKADKRPTISLAVTGSLVGNPIDPVRIDLSDYISSDYLLGGTTDYMTLYGGMESSLYTFSLTMTQPLYTWGKLNDQIEIYEIVHDIRLIYLENTMEQVESELRTRANVLALLRQMGELLDEQEEISERLVELAQSAYEGGFMTRMEALEVKVKASYISTARAQVEQQRRLMLTEIRNLTGNQGLEEDDIEGDLDDFQKRLDRILSLSDAQMREMALSDSGLNLTMLNKLVEVQEYLEHVAESSSLWKPDVALLCTLSYSGPRFPLVETDWFGKDDWQATISVVISGNIIDGGKSQAAVEQAKNEITAAEVDVEAARNEILTQLEQNLTDIDVHLANIEYQEALCEQHSAQAELDKVSMDSGYGSESDWLQSVLEANNATIEALEEKMNLMQAVYTVDYLLGAV